MNHRTLRTTRSFRLALVAATAVTLVACGSDDGGSETGAGPGRAQVAALAAPPAPDAAVTTTTTPRARDAKATRPTTTTTGATATGATTDSVGGSTTTSTIPVVTPIAEVDIGATGAGVQVGTAIDGATAVANLALEGMPIAIGATVAEYSSGSSANLTDPAAPSYYVTSKMISTADTTLPATEIVARYQAAIETLGEYEVTTASANSEGVTTESARLDAVDDLGANYEVAVTISDEQPGLVAIEVSRTGSDVEGTAPEFPAFAAPSFAGPLAVAAANGWTVTEWRFTDGFNQFLGGSPFRSANVSFSAGAGTAADVALLAADVKTAVGVVPDSEDIGTEDFYLAMPDNSSWSGSLRDFWVGNELSVRWSYSE